MSDDDASEYHEEKRATHVDLDAERAVLGAAILDNTITGKLLPIVRPADFYHPAHSVVWEVVEHLARQTARAIGRVHLGGRDVPNGETVV